MLKFNSFSTSVSQILPWVCVISVLHFQIKSSFSRKEIPRKTTFYLKVKDRNDTRMDKVFLDWCKQKHSIAKTTSIFFVTWSWSFNKEHWLGTTRSCPNLIKNNKTFIFDLSIIQPNCRFSQTCRDFLLYWPKTSHFKGGNITGGFSLSVMETVWTRINTLKNQFEFCWMHLSLNGNFLLLLNNALPLKATTIPIHVFHSLYFIQSFTSFISIVPYILLCVHSFLFCFIKYRGYLS